MFTAISLLLDALSHVAALAEWLKDEPKAKKYLDTLALSLRVLVKCVKDGDIKRSLECLSLITVLLSKLEREHGAKMGVRPNIRLISNLIGRVAQLLG